MFLEFLKYKNKSLYKKRTEISYKEKAEIMKNKIIREDANKFKQLCIKDFKSNIEKGRVITIVDFFSNVTYEFQNEISEIVLEELKKEYENIEFSFSFRHCNNSYKGIKMVAI